MTKTPVDSQTEVQLVFILVLMTFRHVKYSSVCLWRSTVARVLQKVTDLQSYIRTSFETQHSTLQKASSCFFWPSSLIERSLSSLSNPSWVSVSLSLRVFSYLLLSSSASSILSSSPSPQSDIILSPLSNLFVSRSSWKLLSRSSSISRPAGDSAALSKSQGLFPLFLQERRITCEISLIFQLLLLDSGEIKWRLLLTSPVSAAQ